MVQYICPKCGKIISRLDGYQYHINRKNSCIIDEKPKQLSKISQLEKKNKEQDLQIQELFSIIKTLQL